MTKLKNLIHKPRLFHVRVSDLALRQDIQVMYLLMNVLYFIQVGRPSSVGLWIWLTVIWSVPTGQSLG